MGNIPDTNIVQYDANMCHYDAKFVHYDANIVQSDAKFVPNETTDWGKFEYLISKYETNSNFQRTEILNFATEELTTEAAEDTEVRNVGIQVWIPARGPG
jgi:hypothetical protein